MVGRKRNATIAVAPTTLAPALVVAMIRQPKRRKPHPMIPAWASTVGTNPHGKTTDGDVCTKM